MILFTVSIIAFTYWKVISVQNYNIKLNVGSRVGIDLGSNEISFGTMQPNSEAVRKINIQNNENNPVRIVVKLKGDALHFVESDKVNFLIDANSYQELSFIAKVPSDVKFGNYTGKATIWVLRA